MAKYLDYEGLKTLWTKVKEKDSSVLSSAKSYADGLNSTEVTNRNTAINTLKTSLTNGSVTVSKATSATSATNATNDGDGNKISTTYVKVSTKGQANGVATLGTDGRIPSSQLPSYVDDVIEGYYNIKGDGQFYKDSAFKTLISGETGKIYVDLSTNVTYRFAGTKEVTINNLTAVRDTYCEISSSLALGTTSSTAYPGSSGAANREDIDKLKGYFSGSVAYSALALTNSEGTSTWNTSDLITMNGKINDISANYAIDHKTSNSYTGWLMNSGDSINVRVAKITTDNNGTTYTDIYSQLYLEPTKAIFGNNTATYIGYKNVSGTATECSDKTFIYAAENLELEGDGSTINLTSSGVAIGASTAKCDVKIYSSSAQINGSNIITQATLSTEVQAITSAELTALLV